MTKIKPKNRLSLQRETLRSLSSETLAMVAGASGHYFCNYASVLLCPPLPPITGTSGTASMPAGGSCTTKPTTFLTISPVENGGK